MRKHVYFTTDIIFHRNNNVDKLEHIDKSCNYDISLVVDKFFEFVFNGI